MTSKVPNPGKAIAAKIAEFPKARKKWDGIFQGSEKRLPSAVVKGLGGTRWPETLFFCNPCFDRDLTCKKTVCSLFSEQSESLRESHERGAFRA